MTKEQEEKLEEFIAVARRVIEPMAKRAQRVNDCTQAEFNKLPGLVRTSVFEEWTGMDVHEIAEAVKTGEIRALERPGKARYFYKSEIARLTGFKM